MARKMTEWPSKRGPITKIMPSDGCIGDTVPLAVGKWYDFHEFGWYMGNVGLNFFRVQNLAAAIPSGNPSVVTVRLECINSPQSVCMRWRPDLSLPLLTFVVKPTASECLRFQVNSVVS